MWGDTSIPQIVVKWLRRAEEMRPVPQARKSLSLWKGEQSYLIGGLGESK
jgi:hypothetical protein